jgi:hypothetical protein
MLEQLGGTAKVLAIRSSDEVDQKVLPNSKPKPEAFRWGRDRIGIGLLTSLRTNRTIEFTDEPSPRINVPARDGQHLVVCVEGGELIQVIAANYAFSLDAGLWMIPDFPRDKADDLLEKFYNSQEQDVSQSEVLQSLKEGLREICGELPLPKHGSLTFITHGLPLGFAFPECPSTHLFDYPDLGIQIVNGFAAEQPRTPGISSCILVDPATTPAPEIDSIVKVLVPRGVYVRVYQGKNANVRAVSDVIEHFPYDLLVIATHCGDVDGYRWTYEYEDSEGIERVLVVDIAVGFGRTGDPDILGVTQFTRFVSLDGIDWLDPSKREKLHVGKAILDWIEQTRPGKGELKPTKRENIPRVFGSSVLKMYDSNFIAMPRSVGGNETPIILSNACVSWHRLAGNFMFGNARAYIGTLVSIGTSEAHDVVMRMLDKFHGKPLPEALWSAQKLVYGDGIRRPYIMSGVFTQRIRSKRHDVLRHLRRRLSIALASWEEMLSRTDGQNAQTIGQIEDLLTWYERELKHLS